MPLNTHRDPHSGSPNAGFTLLEMLIVLVIVGILLAIGAPSFLGWLNRSRLDVSRSEVYSALRLTQRTAMQRKEHWQFSLRETNGQVEWLQHPASSIALNHQSWQALNPQVKLDVANTTLATQNGIYYVRFDHEGNVSHRLGRVTFEGLHGGRAKRCVVVSTLIGALRKGEEQTKPDSSGKYCY